MKRIFEVNVIGSFNVAQQVAQRIINRAPSTVDLTKGDQGAIILTSSYTSTDGQSGSAAYSSTKGLSRFHTLESWLFDVNGIHPTGALSSLVLPMARDLAPYGIRVNAIAPGVFRAYRVNVPTFTASKNTAPRLTVTPINTAFLNERTKCGEFPTRPGRPSEFASFAQHILENEMFNGAVLRQDAAIRGAISID